MKTLYYAQIHSNITYGISMWGPMASCHLRNQIKTLQNKAVKLINHRLEKGSVCKTHGILNVDQLIDLELCKLGYRLMNNLLPKLLSKALLQDQHNQSLQKTHRYNTRHKSVPNLPKAINSRYQNSYLFQAVSTYSKLPEHVTKQTHLKGFTSKCKNYLMEHLMV